ncbi:MAG: flagellar biosynthesis protein FlgN [Treponema sp.]|nr:flagellar biosynthesis protein FlgN [Treponema sp.]
MLTTPKNAETQTEISAQELERRVAILKRFRELLSQQRNHFQEYLTVLDKQKDVIEKGNPDDLIVHVDLEEKIIGDIFAIQKVIDPLEAMYQTHVTETLPGEVREVPSLKAALEELRSEAVIRSARNRDLLSRRMEDLRHEMKTLRANPYAIHRSVFSQQSAALVDIKG